MKWACVLAMAGMSVACTGQAADAPMATETSVPTAEGSAPAATPAPAKPAAPKAVKARVTAAAPVAREVTIPAGTELSLDLATVVASDASKVEDAVRATLREAVRVGNDIVIPAGAELTGVVTEVERSGRVKGRARVAYAFHQIAANGHSYRMETAPVTHEAEATKSEDATKIGVGAGAGALIGGILGGGGGAAKGAAIGGAAGTGAVLATRGKEVRLEPGTPVSATLASPLTVRLRG
jgi:hypothetical protein